MSAVSTTFGWLIAIGILIGIVATILYSTVDVPANGNGWPFWLGMSGAGVMIVGVLGFGVTSERND